MKSLKRNSSLAFAGILLAVFALFAIANLDLFVNQHDIAYDSIELSEDVPGENSFHSKSLSILSQNSSAAAIFETRRPNRQVHFRPLRGFNTQGFLGRSALIFDKLSSLPSKIHFAFRNKLSSYHSPAFFCTAKDYYVYTLKRILC